MKWLQHAFATDPAGPATPTDGQRAVVERLCAEVVRRHLTAPALLLLEMSRPLNFLSAQALHFFHPLVAALTDAAGYLAFTQFLEQRGSIDYLCGRLEHLESECRTRERRGDPTSTSSRPATRP